MQGDPAGKTMTNAGAAAARFIRAAAGVVVRPDVARSAQNVFELLKFCVAGYGRENKAGLVIDPARLDLPKPNVAGKFDLKSFCPKR